MPIDNCYFLFRCGACGVGQKVYNGDPNDLTHPDVDAVKCYRCGKAERLDDLPDADPEFSVRGEPVEVP